MCCIILQGVLLSKLLYSFFFFLISCKYQSQTPNFPSYSTVFQYGRSLHSPICWTMRSMPLNLLCCDRQQGQAGQVSHLIHQPDHHIVECFTYCPFHNSMSLPSVLLEIVGNYETGCSICE